VFEVWPWTARRSRHRAGNGNGHALAAAQQQLRREQRKLVVAEERTDQIDRLAQDVKRVLGLGMDGR